MTFRSIIGNASRNKSRGIPLPLQNWKESFHKNRMGCFLVLPAGLLLILVMVYPLFTLARMSLYDIEPLRHVGEYFIGLKNYLKILQDEELLHALLQTVIWTFGSVILQFILGITAALILNESFRTRSLARALLLIPWAMPSVAGALSWKWMYHAQYGLINYILMSLHLVSQNVNWLGDANLATLAAIITNAWRGFPFMMLMLLAGIQNISKELYEAAAVDGATFFTQVRYIVMPLLTPVIFIVTLLSGIWTFNNFTYIYILTGGGPAGKTEILVTYVYKNGFEYFHFGYAAALSVVLFIIVFLMSLGYVRLSSRDGSSQS